MAVPTLPLAILVLSVAITRKVEMAAAWRGDVPGEHQAAGSGAASLLGQAWPPCGFAPPPFFWHSLSRDANLAGAGTLAVTHRRGVVRSGDEAGGCCAGMAGKGIGDIGPAVSRSDADTQRSAP